MKNIKNAISIIILLTLAVIAGVFGYDNFIKKPVIQIKPSVNIEKKDNNTSDIAQIEPKIESPEVKITPKLGTEAKIVLTPKPEVKSQTILAANGAALTVAGIIAQTNQQRAVYLGAGFSLAENKLLDLAAQKKINDMFAKQYFDHVSPSGAGAADLISGVGYEYLAVGENLALGDYENDADLVAAWMASPGHRENILKSGYTEIGVAVGYGLYNGRKTWLAVQEFGAPKSACPEIDKTLSLQIDADKISLNKMADSQKILAQAIDSEKARAQAFKDELQNLILSGADKKTLQAKQEEFAQAVNQTNKDVKIYNANLSQMRQAYDRYEASVNEYNSQIQIFNCCLGGLQ